jgi:hypothetical protein
LDLRDDVVTSDDSFKLKKIMLRIIYEFIIADLKIKLCSILDKSLSRLLDQKSLNIIYKIIGDSLDRAGQNTYDLAASLDNVKYKKESLYD